MDQRTSSCTEAERSPGELERSAAAIRAYLREAQAERVAGNIRRANAAIAHAHTEFSKLIRKLEPRVGRYSYSLDDQGLAEDAAVAITLELWRRLSNLRPCYNIAERRFNVLFKSAALTALRSVCYEGPKTTDDNTMTPQFESVSLDDPVRSNNGDSEVTLLDLVADPTSQETFDRAIRNAVASTLLGAITDQRHAEVLKCRLCGLPWSEIAGRLQISEKTARDWYKRAQQSVLDQVGDEQLLEQLL